MALLSLGEASYLELRYQLSIAAFSIFAVSILVQVASVFLASATYRNFCKSARSRGACCDWTMAERL